MNKKLTPEAVEAPADEAVAARVRQQAVEAAQETKQIGMQLQRIALRLSELGHLKAGGETLRAAVRLGRVKPGQQA